MRIGIMLGADGARRDLAGLIAVAKRAESVGLDDLWLANIFSFDAITTLALIGRETERIGLGTAVTPTYPRHPTAIAPAGSHRPGRQPRALHAGDRAFPQAGHRGHAGPLLPTAGGAHARVSASAHAPRSR